MQHDPGGGAPITNISINNYNNNGAPASNGGAGGEGTSMPPAGDPGGDPAPPSSSAGPSGTYSGGGDCATPPMCTGDAVMCGVARQEWTAMCSGKASLDELHKDLAGTEPAPTMNEIGGGYGSTQVWSDSLAGDPSTVGGSANLGIYNMQGFGAPTACPLHDMVIPVIGGKTITIPLEQGCVPLGYLRYLLIAGALYRAARITMGGNG